MSTDNHSQWTDAFKKEIAEVRQRHIGEQPVEENLVGLAFSGGGIRSATFGLGVLEALKDFGLLKKIHYLSTVSGGGYIGAWLSANCKRNTDWLDRAAVWTDSIAHLRRYSNYLSPKVGFFSADTWSMATIWLRNTLLIQLTVILAIAVVLLLPRRLLAGFQEWPQVGHYWRWTTIVVFLIGVVGIAGNQLLLNKDVPLLQVKNWPRSLAIAAICLLAAWAYGAYVHFDPFDGAKIDYGAAAPIAGLLVLAGFWLHPAAVKLVGSFWPGKNVAPVDPRGEVLEEAVRIDSDLPENQTELTTPKQINYTQAWVQWMVVVPMMATGYLVAAILWDESQPGKHTGLDTLDSFGGFFLTAWLYWPFPLSVVFVSLWLLSFCSIRSWDWRGMLAAFGAPVPAILVLHALLCCIMLLLHEWANNATDGDWVAFVWTPAMVLFAFTLTIVMLIGMMGRQSTEGVREWWSRLGAWLGIYGFAWMVIAVAAFYGPLWVAAFVQDHPWTSLSAGGGALGTILAGLFAGKSESTGGEEKKGRTTKIMEVVAAVAPFVFIAGLLIAVSTGLDQIIRINFPNNKFVSLYVLAGCSAALLLMAMRVDINEFSLNAFYRNRLVRCYLGATRLPGERKPQNFTGFDDDDDIPMSNLRPSAGPLHIVNCALNLGGSSDLALHTRHSANFTLSPLQCGSSYQSREQTGDKTGEKQELGYVATAEYGGKDGQPTLGQAISVSGAAASPNMGYHTSPAVAFLLTVFNVRLGWWYPNPRMSWIKWPSPHFNLTYLFKELFGGADDKSKFLMISDGGHFENLAAYELVKRRCRVIIISDAECDSRLRFEGLGTLIRMCDVDFGAKITLDVGAIRPGSESIWSSSRCAVGTIDYGKDEYGKKIPYGILIYLKASMTGHEDTAVLQYKASHPHFPHETTGDQFYGEDQFESYRRLGRDIAFRTFEPVSGEGDFVAIACKLLDICSPTLDHIGRFTEHTTRLMDLWSQLASNPDLQNLDEELVGGSWPKNQPAGFRSAFYICSEMIQLMENVYLGLRLEDTWDHPDNKGWRATFTTWAKSTVLKKTWEITSETYGLRFQYFCARHLELPIPGKVAGKGDSGSDCCS